MSENRSAPVRSAEALGEEVARLRQSKGLSQADLASALGVHRRYLYGIESAPPGIYVTRLFEVLRELGAHVEIVVDDDAPGWKSDTKWQAALAAEFGRDGDLVAEGFAQDTRPEPATGPVTGAGVEGTERA